MDPPSRSSNCPLAEARAYPTRAPVRGVTEAQRRLLDLAEGVPDGVFRSCRGTAHRAPAGQGLLDALVRAASGARFPRRPAALTRP